MHPELIQNGLKIRICIHFWFRFHALHSFLIQTYKKILRIMGFAFIFDSDAIQNWFKLRICIHFWFKCHSKLNHHKIWIHFCLKIMISCKNWLEIKICMHLWLRCVIFIRIWFWFSWRRARLASMGSMGCRFWICINGFWRRCPQLRMFIIGCKQILDCIDLIMHECLQNLVFGLNHRFDMKAVIHYIGRLYIYIYIYIYRTPSLNPGPGFW